MLLPIRTSIYPKKTPYANYLLIALNVIVFFLSYWPHEVFHPAYGRIQEALRPWAQQFMLTADQPYLWQFVTYAFLHGSIMHIFGNMYFLYIFGNNVNDKLGNIGYVCFYLAGGVFSGLGHSLLHTSPVLGASGAVAAVTGAYLVLFPNTLITVIYWLFFIGTVEIRALYFIAFKLIVYDNMIEPKFSSSNIAYDAHMAGYFSGILIVLGLHASGLIKGDFNDLWSMLRQWNRRRQFRDVMSDGHSPRQAGQERAENPQYQSIMDIRSRIHQTMTHRNPADAARLYLELLQIDESQILPKQLQLDIANQLMAEGKWPESARAYQKFLSQYANYEYAEQVHLMLGLLYRRYLNQPEQAMKHLQTALEHLTDPNQIQMCRDEIEKLRNGS